MASIEARPPLQFRHGPNTKPLWHSHCGTASAAFFVLHILFLRDLFVCGAPLGYFFSRGRFPSLSLGDTMVLGYSCVIWSVVAVLGGVRESLPPAEEGSRRRAIGVGWGGRKGWTRGGSLTRFCGVCFSCDFE